MFSLKLYVCVYVYTHIRNNSIQPRHAATRPSTRTSSSHTHTQTQTHTRTHTHTHTHTRARVCVCVSFNIEPIPTECCIGLSSCTFFYYITEKHINMSLLCITYNVIKGQFLPNHAYMTWEV